MANLSRNDQLKELGLVQEVETSVTRLMREQSICATTINDTQELVRQIDGRTLKLDVCNADIALTMSETRASVKRLTNETLYIREVTERIETASRELVGSALGDQSLLPSVVAKELEAVITKNLRRELKKTLRRELDQHAQRCNLDINARSPSLENSLGMTTEAHAYASPKSRHNQSH